MIQQTKVADGEVYIECQFAMDNVIHKSKYDSNIFFY